MKKVAFLTATLLAVGLMFTSCQKEQSELTMEMVKGKAHITGKVVYNEGFAKESGVIVADHMAPAVGQTVMVQVNTRDYAEGAVGKQTFKATTDEKGMYTIEIPVSVRGVEATVSVVPFRATKYFRDDEDNLVPKADVLFNECDAKTVSLTEESYQTCDLRVESEESLDVTYSKVTTVSGNIVTRVWKKETDDNEETTWTANTYKGVPNVAVEAKISITKNDKTTELIIKTTTNAEGEYDFDLTLPSGYKNSEVYMQITSTPFVGEYEHHYYETENETWKTQMVDVVYGPVSFGRELGSSDYITPIQNGDQRIATDPVNREEVKGIGNNTDRENGIAYNNPLNW